MIEGTLDVADGTLCRVAGWTRDSATPASIAVDIYRDGPQGTGALVFSGSAEHLRADLPFADKNHGFDFALPPDPALADGASHPIFAYGINASTGSRALLNRSGLPIRCGVLSSVVTDYGAKGDGVSDDSDAIQRAIDDTFSGGVLHIPAGTYMLGTPHGQAPYPAPIGGVTGESYALDVSKPITITGAGRNSILKLMPVRLGILLIHGTSGVLVEKLVLDGNAGQRYLRNPATGVSYDWPLGNIVAGLVLGGSSTGGATIRDCELRNALEDGAGMLPGPGFSVQGCYIHDMGAFALDGSDRGGGAGISMNGGQSNKALHNVILRATHGIVVGFGPRDHVLENNTIVGGCNGLVVGSGPAGNDSDAQGVGFTIVDNVIERNGVCSGLGFQVNGKDAGIVKDNAIIDNAGWTGAYIGPQPVSNRTSTGWTLIDNLIANTDSARSQAAGLFIDATSAQVVLQGNRFSNNGQRLADQVIIQSPSSVNAGWQATNAVSYSPVVPVPPPAVTDVLHAATLGPGSVAPGQTIVIRGQGLGPQTAVAAQVTKYGRVARSVASVRVLFDDVAAPLLSVSANEITAVVPYFTYWKDTARLQVEYQGVRSNPTTVQVAASNPGIYAQSLLNEDGIPNSMLHPARPGALVTFLATGEGQTDPAGIDGQVTSAGSAPRPRAAVSVLVDGKKAEIVAVGQAPALPAGKLEVTVRLPSDLATGVALPVTLSIGGQQAVPTATIYASGAVVPATVVEYYNTSLDHYFISWNPGEIAKLDAGVEIKGWTRTGKALTTYTAPATNTSPVCRFYIPPALGDSHFFGRGTAECEATGRNNRTFVLEDPAFMHMYLPVAGVCPAGSTEVYRVFDNRQDANHRYMTDLAVRSEMIAKGWLAEGDGPNLVTMCAPR
ncbi:MAG: right-handed parallel beta-helix repeat-containing protein [Burkholderiales bacterium]